MTLMFVVTLIIVGDYSRWL